MNMVDVDYPETADSFVVREATPDDGDVIAHVLESSPDTGEISRKLVFNMNAYHAFSLTGAHADGSVTYIAETPEGEPAGVGFATVNQCRIDDELRPVTKLHQVAVHPDHRGQGLAKRLAAERIRYGREEFDASIVYATIQQGNGPSEAVAETWSTAAPYQRTRTTLSPVEDATFTTDYEFREPHEEEFEEFADGLNEFYSEAALFSPSDAESLAQWMEWSFDGVDLSTYLVATDGDEIKAGVRLTKNYEAAFVKIDELPPDVDSTEELPDSIPESLEIKPLGIGDLWHKPGEGDALRDLVEYVRESPGQANRLSLGFDLDGPLADVFDVDEGSVMLNVKMGGEPIPNNEFAA